MTFIHSSSGEDINRTSCYVTAQKVAFNFRLNEKDICITKDDGSNQRATELPMFESIVK